MIEDFLNIIYTYFQWTLPFVTCVVRFTDLQIYPLIILFQPQKHMQ